MLNDADAAGLEAEISAATKIYLELEQDLTRHMALGFADVETAVGALYGATIWVRTARRSGSVAAAVAM